MSRLFSAYVMIDWSAAAAPRQGKDSIWIGVIKRDIRFRPTFEAFNPATRDAAMVQLRDILADLGRRGERALVGVDFALGYPEGTAALLKVKGEDWAGLWAFLAKDVVDKPTNVNNRFQVAAKMNRLMTDEAYPMWGAPAKQTQRWLTATKPPQGTGDIPEYRATENAVRKGKLQPKSNWQMHGAGAVGGQTLVGIPMVRRLLEHLGPSAAAWPFGTGWRALDTADVEPLSVLIAEVWPSIFDAKPEEGEFKDQAQVRKTAEAFALMDEKGDLSKAFAPPKGTDEALIAQVEGEEGWILGVGA